MDKLHLSILSAWTIMLIYDRVVALTGIDLIMLPFVGLLIVTCGLCTFGKKENKSEKEEA